MRGGVKAVEVGLVLSRDVSLFTFSKGNMKLFLALKLPSKIQRSATKSTTIQK
jgi:hypothetical protein